MKSIFLPSIVVFVGILLAIAQYIYTEHWYVKKIDVTAFENEGRFTQAEVPTTYYHKGQIRDVLKQVKS
jgi:hypothetical protein